MTSCTTSRLFVPRGPKDGPVQTFQFRTSFVPDPWQTAHPPADPYVWQWTWPGASVQDGNMVATHGFDLAQAEPRLHGGIARALRAYQRVGYTPGPVLAASVLVALAAGLRRLGRARRQEWWAAALLVSVGLTVLVIPAATASFDFRYLLPALPLLPPAGVLGIVILRARGHRSTGRAAPSVTMRGPARSGATGPRGT